MTLNYCTLINSFYLARALVMHESLEKACPNFHLYLFAFDDKTYRYFLENPKSTITVIPLKDFEDPELLRVKPTRTPTEYCWTSTPSTILYCIEKFKLDHCTYIDADMYFFSDPSVLHQEMETAGKSVLITEHRYTPEYDQSKESGIYCVQYVTIKNNPTGMEVLRDWRKDCLNWCHCRIEDGKFGDQKYLDAWPDKYDGIHVLRHIGGGVAPWNVQRYKISGPRYRPRLLEKSTGLSQELVFFHYHGLKFHPHDTVEYTAKRYKLTMRVKARLYRRYVHRLFDMAETVTGLMPDITNPNGASSETKPGRVKNFILVHTRNLINIVRYYLGRTPRFGVLHSNVYRRRPAWNVRISDLSVTLSPILSATLPPI